MDRLSAVNQGYGRLVETRESGFHGEIFSKENRGFCKQISKENRRRTSVIIILQSAKKYEEHIVAKLFIKCTLLHLKC